MKLFLFLFLIASASFGAPLVLEKGKDFYELGLHLELFEDPSGKLSIDEVEGKEFYPSREKVPNFGFSGSAFWGRVTVLNKIKKRDWFLSYNYVNQDYVTFFKKVGGKWVFEEMGDSKKFSERKYKIRSFVFEASKDEKEVYYIRTSGNPTQFNLSFLTKEKMLLLEGEYNVKYSLFFGIVIAMVLYNVFIFFFTKSISYFYYIFYVIFFGLFIGGRKGLTQKYFFTDNVWLSNSGLLFFGAMLSIFLCLFTIEYLNLQKTTKWIYRFLIGSILLGLIVVIFSFFAPYETTVKLFLPYTLLIAVNISVACVNSMIKGYRPARFFVFAYFFMLVGSVISNLTMSDILPIYLKEAIIIGGALELILLSMGLADKFNYQQEQALIKEKTLTNQLDKEVSKSKLLYEKVLNLNEGLEDKVAKRTEELRETLNKTEGMLSNINKAIFSADSTGKVHSPVSNYSNTLFGKNIVGDHALKLLFFHFKDGSEEKNKLINAFQGLFGGTEGNFLNLKGSLPRQVTVPHKEKKKGLVLDIQYVPLYDPDSKIEKLMFIVEDVTKSEQEYRKNKKASLNHDAFMEVLSYDNKDALRDSLSLIIERSISSLEKMTKTGVEEHKREDITKTITNLVTEFNSGACSKLGGLNRIILSTQDEIQYIKDQDLRRLLVWSVEKVSNIFLHLMRYAEALNILHKSGIGSGVSYALPEGFENSIDEKIGDLERIMVNLLEYIFLVRKVEDLDEGKISNAPKKARLYVQFDDIISLVMNRSRLIAFLLKVSGKTKKSDSYMELSELLRQMPSKDKLTEAALINHLIEPYKKAVS